MSHSEFEVPPSNIIDGFRLPHVFSAESFRSAVRYQPRKDDLFLVTYPKCGTTWAQQILSLILSQGDLEQSFGGPFLELKGAQAAKAMTRPGFIKTHLPFKLVPWSEEAKYIYIARNPKDCCVSYYYHHMSHQFTGNFDDFFEMFLSGDVNFGDYFDHLLGWYEYSPGMANKEEKKILPDYKDTGYGLKISSMFSLDAFKSALEYKPHSDDLFIVTYPKCGTTWVQNIVGCIYREGKPFTSAIEFLSSTPFLEMAGAEAAKTMKRPGAIKLHLPFHLTPYSKEAKYIFIARNPKDCVVSFYHHTRNMIGYKFKNGKFDDYFELFMKGEVDFGDYFDCLLSWYEHRDDPNVLFITYEQLKEDTRTYILKIAEFMGQKYKDMLVNDEDMLNDVIKYSSFSFMKETMNKKVSELAALPRDVILNHPDIPQGLKILLAGKEEHFFDPDPNSISFVRKGVVGDWRNYLSPEQNRRLNEKFEERTKGTDIANLWKDYMA